MTNPVQIASPQNDRIKALVRLRSRRERDRQGVFLIEGTREVSRALEAGIELSEAYVAPDLFHAEAQRTADRLDERRIPHFELSEEAFRKASYRDSPDGILVVAPTWTPALDSLELGPDALLLVVDGLEKPGNVGALLRTADAAGATAVFVTGAGTDIFNPNVIRASMGSVFARPVLPAATDELKAFCDRNGIRIVATSPAATRSFWDADLTGRIAIVVGSEHAGLEAAWLGAADLRVQIPMTGLADSLNVATSGALLLYEALRQRRP